MPWRIVDEQGTEWKREEDVTTAEVVTVCQIIQRDSWEAGEPTRGPAVLSAWIVMLMAQRTGGSIMDCTEIVFKMPFGDVLAMLKVE